MAKLPMEIVDRKLSGKDLSSFPNRPLTKEEVAELLSHESIVELYGVYHDDGFTYPEGYLEAGVLLTFFELEDKYIPVSYGPAETGDITWSLGKPTSKGEDTDTLRMVKRAISEEYRAMSEVV